MERPQLVQPFKLVSALTVVLVLLQAFMAGRGVYIDHDLLKDHGYVGDVTFISVVLQCILVARMGIPNPLRNRLLGLNVLLLILVTIQLALGYNGRDSSTAAAWHVPNGVLIFGLACFNMALAAQLPRRNTA
jgi:hypothetical protein